MEACNFRSRGPPRLSKPVAVRRLIPRSGRALRVAILLVGTLLVAACRPAVAPPAPTPAPAPPPPATRGSSFHAVGPTAVFTPVPAPQSAAAPGTGEWYRAPAPGGLDVLLGVYRPNPAVLNPATVLVLHGGDGLRRQYETIAASYAAQGFIGIVGCWFDDPSQALVEDSVSCSGGPAFKGSETAAVADLDALLAAADQVADVDLARVAIVGHSYGATVALLRAAHAGAVQPIVSSSGLLAATPLGVGAPRAGNRYPADEAAGIDGPLMIVHGASDPITPIGQAQALVAALAGASKPTPTIAYYPAPAGHSIPWQADAFPGRPGASFSSAFINDSSAWIAAQLP